MMDVDEKWNTSLGLLIRYHRINKGMKQCELADKLGVSRVALCGWERGRTGIKASTLRCIELILNVEFFKPFLLEN